MKYHDDKSIKILIIMNINEITTDAYEYFTFTKGLC